MNNETYILLGGAAILSTAAALYLLKNSKNAQNLDPADFLQAAKDGKVGLIVNFGKKLENPDNPRTQEDGETALQLAVRYNHLAAAKELLAQGSSVQATNFYLFTPVHTACFYGADSAVLSALIEKSPNLEAPDQNGWRPIHVATSKSNLPLVRLLVGHGAEFDSTTAAGESPLLISANNGFEEGVEYFLSLNANPLQRRAKTMDSSLILATWNGHIKIIKMLVKADEQLLRLSMSDGTVPFHVAAGVGNLKLIDLFVEEFKCDVNVTKRDGSNALHMAVASESSNCILAVKRLIDLGCSLKAKDRFGCTPFHRAAGKKNLELVKIFLQAGASPHFTDNDGVTPLHSICTGSKGNNDPTEHELSITLLKEFLDHGADFTITDQAGANILHYAVSRTSNVPLIQFILKTKPNLAFAVDRSDRTPLHLLTMYPNKEVKEILEKHMKDINPEFFDTFDPKHRVDFEKNFIHSTLEKGQKFAVLNGDVSLNGIVKKIRNGEINNIVVLTGAGISTSAGIPDFRGEKGIYKDASIKEKFGVAPSSMFSVSTFESNPAAFYGSLKEYFLPVMQGVFKPTACHRFIAHLEKKGKLLRNFTQNIDTLERQAGVSPEKLVEAHGSFARVICTRCGFKSTDTASFWKDVENDAIPMCTKCSTKEKQNPLQPDVTLFGQALPDSFFDFQNDLAKCDLLIVMGTTLQVYPFASLVNVVPDSCPRLLFNQEAVGPFTNGVKMRFSDGTLSQTDSGYPGTYRDVACLGDIDQNVSYFWEQIEKQDD